MTTALSVEQLIAALQRKSMPVPFETGAFLVLEASERVAADPVVISSAELRIRDDGELVMPARAGSARPSPREACRALAGVLGELLVCSAQSVPPMLLRLVQSGVADGPSTPAELRDELEATLVPLNRAAMRRVVARLVREAKRALEEGRPRLSVHPHPADQEQELDAILGGRSPASRAGRPRSSPAGAGPAWHSNSADEENAELDAVLAGLERKPSAAGKAGTAALKEDESRGFEADKPADRSGRTPTTTGAGRDSAGHDAATSGGFGGAGSGVDASGGGSDLARSQPHHAPQAEAETPEVRLREPPIADEHSDHPGPARAAHRIEADGSPWNSGEPASQRPAAPRAAQPRLALGDQGDTLDRFEDLAGEGGSSRGTRVGWAAVLLVAVLAGGYFVLGRDRSRSLVGLEPAAEPTAPPAAPVRAAPASHGTLRVASTPPRAQVLVRVGKGPALASKLPTGVVHEFVAMRAGYSPSRAIVPADAQWQVEGGERRYELALQLRETNNPSKEDELGPARLPAALGTPSGSLGSVRIVTSPPGADVYQLIGFTPDVALENLAIDDGLELLIYSPDHEPKHVSLGRADWKSQGGTYSADVQVTLLRRAGARDRK